VDQINKNRKAEDREKGKDVEHILEEENYNLPISLLCFVVSNAFTFQLSFFGNLKTHVD
jgi:hypothetical protein